MPWPRDDPCRRAGAIGQSATKETTKIQGINRQADIGRENHSMAGNKENTRDQWTGRSSETREIQRIVVRPMDTKEQCKNQKLRNTSEIQGTNGAVRPHGDWLP